VYACLRILQIETEMFGKSFYRRLAGVVRRIAGRISDTLLTSCDDNGRRFAKSAGLKQWHVAIQAVDHTIEICVEDLDMSEIIEFMVLAVIVPYRNTLHRPTYPSLLRPHSASGSPHRQPALSLSSNLHDLRRLPLST
jgi:hypothetical protein